MRYSEKLHRHVKGSMSHLRVVLRMLEKHELLRVEPTSKVRRLVLTEKGRKVAMHLLAIRGELGDGNA